MNARHSSLLALLFIVLFASCEKKEQPVILPPATGALAGHVDMGENYERQVFYDFQRNEIVSTSDPNSWDLAFETGTAGGFHVWMNGGKGVLLYNTHLTSLAAVRDLPANSSNPASWLIDQPCGLPDSTAVGNWKDGSGQSKKEVFIARIDAQTYRKFQLISVSDSGYEMMYADIQEPNNFRTIIIPKDTAYSFSYFHFTTGIVKPDPPKAAWDVVFTGYRSIVWDAQTNSAIPYEVHGVLLNAARVSAAADSVSSFDALTYGNCSSAARSNNRDVIGYDWKSYDIAAGLYTVNKKKCYILNTRDGQLFKLHFLDFYNAAGQKGSPSFESQRLQ